MIQLMEAADLGALGLDQPTIGTATVRAVVHVVRGRDHRMRLRVENSTGAWWVFVFPYRQDQREVVEGDLIHARFSVHRRTNRVEAWANDLRVVTAPTNETPAGASIQHRLSIACRSSSRVLVHTLALMAVAGETLDTWTVLDSRSAKQTILTAITTLPHAESHLLLRAASALDV
jgi:hypothetical protein